MVMQIKRVVVVACLFSISHQNTVFRLHVIYKGDSMFAPPTTREIPFNTDNYLNPRDRWTGLFQGISQGKSNLSTTFMMKF